MVYEVRFWMRSAGGWSYAGRYQGKQTAERVRRVLARNHRVLEAVLVKRPG